MQHGDEMSSVVLFYEDGKFNGQSDDFALVFLLFAILSHLELRTGATWTYPTYLR